MSAHRLWPCGVQRSSHADPSKRTNGQRRDDPNSEGVVHLILESFVILAYEVSAPILYLALYGSTELVKSSRVRPISEAIDMP